MLNLYIELALQFSQLLAFLLSAWVMTRDVNVKVGHGK